MVSPEERSAEYRRLREALVAALLRGDRELHAELSRQLAILVGSTPERDSKYRRDPRQ